METKDERHCTPHCPKTCGNTIAAHKTVLCGRDDQR